VWDTNRPLENQVRGERGGDFTAIGGGVTGNENKTASIRHQLRKKLKKNPTWKNKKKGNFTAQKAGNPGRTVESKPLMRMILNVKKNDK